MSEGLVCRVALLHACIAIGNLLIDFPALSGEQGLIPHTQFLTSVAKEFYWTDIPKFFPSLLFWVDGMTLLWTGIAVCVIGLAVAKLQRFSCFFAYLVLLSFSHCQGVVLWFPWDCLLLETLFLAAVCPSSLWTFRLLLFRVMFGFGKHKFLGADSLEDLTYTASMSCWQPLGTNLGWLMTWLPDVVHVGAILFTFAAELVSPFLLWTRYRRIACISIIVLMTMIQITGHFGWFNTLTAALAFVVFVPQDFPEGSIAHEKSNFMSVAFKRPLRYLYLALSVLFLIPSQWNSPSLFYQHTFMADQWDVVRIASAWRVLHTYGVFPPKKMPMIKPVGRFTVLDEAGRESALEYNYQISGNTSESGFSPFSVAPLRFPRFDYINGFYSASHVFSLGTRLGPSFGTGEEFVESVAKHLLDPRRRSDVSNVLFSNFSALSEVRSVRFYVVGLTPSARGGWEEFSVELDKEFTVDAFRERPGKEFSVTYSLPPNMVALRSRSKKFRSLRNVLESKQNPERAVLKIVNSSKTINEVRQTLWDAAVILVERPDLVSERDWMGLVDSRFKELAVQAGFSPVSAVTAHCSGKAEGELWDLCHAMQFGGYIGCLTSAHLLPPFVHSPLCPEIMLANLRARQSGGSSFNKIPISDLVYWILGLLGDVISIRNSS